MQVLFLFVLLFALCESINLKINSKFMGYVQRFQDYDNVDIRALGNDRLQQLLLGGKEALSEPAVVQAFSILYEDLLPVRMGGDILFNLLEKSMNQAKISRKTLDIAPLSGTKNSVKSKPIVISDMKKKIIGRILMIAKSEADTIDSCYAETLFPRLDVDNDGYISKEEFSSWVESVVITDLEETGFADKVTCATFSESDLILSHKRTYVHKLTHRMQITKFLVSTKISISITMEHCLSKNFRS